MRFLFLSVCLFVCFKRHSLFPEEGFVHNASKMSLTSSFEKCVFENIVNFQYPPPPNLTCIEKSLLKKRKEKLTSMAFWDVLPKGSRLHLDGVNKLCAMQLPLPHREGQTIEGNSTSRERRKREMSCISSIIHTESQWSDGDARGHRGGGVMTYKGGRRWRGAKWGKKRTG